MKKSMLIYFLCVPFMVTALGSCGKKAPEKTKTIQLTKMSLEMDVPESWSATKESETSTEISAGGKGDKRLFYVEPADGIDGNSVTPEILESAVDKDAGFKVTEKIKLKNGIGIRYEEKPKDKVRKRYWFIVVAKGKSYSVESGVYNSDGKYFDLEKVAIESIR